MATGKDFDKSVSSICKGTDKKEDALMLMSPDCNWGEFLVPGPCAVVILGDLILISAGQEFSLEEKAPAGGYKHLRYPSSFRASLVQVSNAGWSAFNEAHKSMDQIHLFSGNVDNHIKKTVTLLMNGSAKEVELVVPKELKKVQKIADECLSLAEKIESKFIGVMELTGELLEACTLTKGVYDKHNKETVQAILAAKEEEKLRTAEKDESERRLKSIQQEVESAHKDYKDALDSIPSTGSLLGTALAETMLDGVRGVINIVPGILKGVQASYTMTLSTATEMVKPAVHDKAYLNKEMSKHIVYSNVSTIDKYIGHIARVVFSGDPPSINKDEIQNGTVLGYRKGIETCRLHVDEEEDSGKLRKSALSLCSEAHEICDNLIALTTSLDASEKAKDEAIANKLETLQRKSRKLATKASKELGKNPLDNQSPHLSQMEKPGDNASISQRASADARYKTEHAKESLKDARLRQDKTDELMKQTNEQLLKVMQELQHLQLDKVDFDQIRATLVKGIKALGEIREKWGKLVRFFEMLSNLIKCSLHSSLTNFVDESNSIRQLKMMNEPCNVLRDTIFEEASRANQIAYVVHSISGAYVEISNGHLMDRVAALGRLLHLDPETDKHEIQIKREELYTGCEKAQEAIMFIVAEEKRKFNANIDKRIAQIENLEKSLPSIEPAKLVEIKEDITKGMEASAIDDLV